MAEDKHIYRQDHAKMQHAAETGVPEPIPGEHDHSTEAATEPAIVGSTGFGGDLPKQDVDPTVDDDTLRDRRWESGGKVKGQTSKVR